MRLAVGNRAVASTQMNMASSRSHVIFTLFVERSSIVPPDSNNDDQLHGKLERYFRYKGMLGPSYDDESFEAVEERLDGNATGGSGPASDTNSWQVTSTARAGEYEP